MYYGQGACITDKVREARMRWYGHVMRREDGCCIKRIMNAEVYGRRSRGRQKKRWRDKIQEDLKKLKLKKEDADDRNKWRRRIRVAGPSPRRDYFEPEGERKREREQMISMDARPIPVTTSKFD